MLYIAADSKQYQGAELLSDSIELVAFAMLSRQAKTPHIARITLIDFHLLTLIVLQ